MKKPHIPLLKVFDDFKFNLGKRTLIDFVKGDPNPTIEKNSLDELNSYGCLYMLEKGHIASIVEQLIKKGFLEIQTVGAGFQVVVRTSKGIKEIFEQSFEPTSSSIHISPFKTNFEETKITDNDKKLFDAFNFFLEKYNDEQKKSIISAEKNILCIAGAGTGKTTVLTKRIEYLTKFRSVKEEKILAVTFTKKAKEEMQNRLEKLGIIDTKVETFNSFCEKLLKKYGDKIYDQNVKVASYGDKISIVRKSMEKVGVTLESFSDSYFNKRQLREKSAEELFFIFVNDVFSVIDYYKNSEKEIEKFYERETHGTKKRISKFVYETAVSSCEFLNQRGFRDFSDQIVDVLRLFRKHPELVPKFEYILVDEYQDVNLVQFELLKILKSENIFVVGDPRQAIYGWRGSEIKYILDFPKHFNKTQVIQLKMNYRSKKQIVDFANESIKNLGLVDLKSSDESKESNCIFLVEQDNEILEKRFVLEAIKNSKNSRNEIFVLARTNRILEGYADFFSQNGVAYTIKSEEEYKNGEPQENEVVLATVHSIKGMEAKEVYLVSCNSLSFPNKVVDNFVLALMKEDDDYDKTNEELRLFYVALTRAKEKLVVTYTGNYSKFISANMLNVISFKAKNKNLFEYDGTSVKSSKLDASSSTVLKNMIKEWRAEISNQTGLPTYMIISNKAIDDLALMRPQTKVELLNVNGLGDAKIAKYGDEILRIING